MNVSCAACGVMDATAHIVLEARCRARWRGKSFDADGAMANVGLAVGDVLKMSPSRFDEFQRHVRVSAFRDDRDDNPPERFDPDEGERWVFHVALLGPVSDDVLQEVKERARAALDASRNFEAARLAD